MRNVYPNLRITLILILKRSGLTSGTKFNIFLTCLTIYFIQKYNFPMGVASLTFFDFATLRFHFAIFTIVFVIDQINEASPCLLPTRLSHLLHQPYGINYLLPFAHPTHFILLKRHSNHIFILSSFSHACFIKRVVYLLYIKKPYHRCH